MAQLKALLLQPLSKRNTFVAPLGLGYLAAVLKAKGAAVRIIDANAAYARYDDEKIVRIVEQEHFDLVGITINTIFCMFAYDLLRALPKSKETLVITGGPHVSLFAHESLEYGADIAVRGEGEETMADIIDYLKGKRQLSEIPGISYRRPDKEIVDNPPRPLIRDLDRLPFPDKDAFTFNDYVRKPNDIDKFSNILTSRGCPGQCTYCSKDVFGNRFRFRSPANIIAEIKFLHQRFGLRRFVFVDDAMTLNAGRITELIERMSKELDFSLAWDCITRTDFVRPELLRRMGQAGCRRIYYGVESANPETLKRIKKHTSVEQSAEILVKTKEAGIQNALYIMWGFPWEDTGDLQRTRDFLKRMKPYIDWVAAGGLVIPFPGTALYRQYSREYGFTDWWLKLREFTGNYRVLRGNSLFRDFFYDDADILNNRGFFNYSPQIKKALRRHLSYVAFFNLSRKTPLYLLFALFFCFLSALLYKLSPKLELYLQKIFYLLLRLKAGRFNKPIKGQNN